MNSMYQRRCKECHKYFPIYSKHETRKICNKCRGGKKMRLVPILIVLLLLPSVTSYQINTTVTIDWVGNDNAYLRTEVGDFLFNANASNQIDQSFILNITRYMETNRTDAEYIISQLNVVSATCTNISTLCYSKKIYDDNQYWELVANWSRCNLDKNALMLQASNWESAKQNYSRDMINCDTLRASLQSTINSYSQSYLALSANVSALDKKAKDNTVIGLFIGAGIVGVIWFIQNQQKKNKAHPDEMVEMAIS